MRRFGWVRFWMLAALFPSLSFAWDVGVRADDPGEEGGVSEVEARYAEMSAPKEFKPASQQVMEERDRYLSERELNLGSADNPGGAYIEWGQGLVSVAPTSPGYVKARYVAYQRALADAQARYVQFQSKRVTTRTLSELFSDDSQLDPRSIEKKSTAQVIKDKTAALTEAKLDKALSGLGVDPRLFDGQTFEKKKTLFEESLLKNSITRAAGSVAGLRPLVTFEGVDEKGSAVVGVLAVISEKFRQLAYEISVGRLGQSTAGRIGEPISQQIPKEPGELMDELGIRVLIDENGDRCVVAFGQWSFIASEAQSARQQERGRNNARDRAEAQADAAIADFVGACLNFEEEAVMGEVVQEYVVTHKDGFQEHRDIVDFVDRLSRTITIKADATIRGLSTIHTWSGKHPDYGQNVVGVIRSWSPTSQAAADALRKWRPQFKKARQEAAAKAKIKRSKDFDNPADW